MHVGFNKAMRSIAQAVMAGIWAGILHILTFAALSWPALPVAGESLVKAVEDDDFQQVQRLVAGGDEVDATAGIQHNTALMVAVSMGRNAVASYLLDMGADIDRQNSQGIKEQIRSAKDGTGGRMLSYRRPSGLSDRILHPPPG